MKKKVSHKPKHARWDGAVSRTRAAKAKPMSPEQLYEKVRTPGYMSESLGGGMSVAYSELCVLPRHPCYLLDDIAHRAYEFVDDHWHLRYVRDCDIDMASLAGLRDECLRRVRERYFWFGSWIHRYEDGLALVCWQLSPDSFSFQWAGEDVLDGFENSEEAFGEAVNIYGVIDAECRVVVPFRLLDGHTDPKELLVRVERRPGGFSRKMPESDRKDADGGSLV